MTEKNKKNKLITILTNAERKAEDIVSKGREMVQQGQFATDIIHCTQAFIQSIPDDSYLTPEAWDRQISQWQDWRNRADTVLGGFNEMSTLTIATSGTASSTSTVILTEVISSLPSPAQPQARQAYEKFEQTLEQSNLIQKIGDEIKRLGLPSTSLSGKEPPLALLRQAEAAFKVPSIDGVAPSAVLIPLREAINCVIANLLQKRPTQEKTGRIQEKIQSICNQCSHAGVVNEQITNRAKEAYDLNDHLSSAKQNQLTRDQVRELLNRGIVFLLAFLQMLDEQKMRTSS